MAERKWTEVEWREIGGMLMLVSKGGGAKVALCARGSEIQTRDPDTGALRPLRPDDPIARATEASPEMAELLEKSTQALNDAWRTLATLECEEEARAVRIASEANLALLSRINGGGDGK